MTCDTPVLVNVASACSASNGGGAIDTYAWSDTGGGSGTLAAYGPSWATADLYEVTLEATNAGGTSSDSMFVSVQLPTYELTVDANPDAGGTPTGGGTYDDGTSVEISAGTNAGYVFNNWTGCTPDNANSTTTNVTVSADTTCTANFTVEQFTLTVNASPGAGGTPTGGGTYDTGTSVPISAGTNAGYVFNNWTGCTPDNANSASTKVTVRATTT